MTQQAAAHAAKSVRTALLLGGVQLVGALLLTLAHKSGVIDNETTTRAMMVLIGLVLMVMGNAMPKQLDGSLEQTAADVAIRQAILRFGGYAMLLGGLAWTIFWTFAPRDVAQFGSVTALGSAVAIMIAYSIWRYRSGRSGSH